MAVKGGLIIPREPNIIAIFRRTLDGVSGHGYEDSAGIPIDSLDPCRGYEDLSAWPPAPSVDDEVADGPIIFVDYDIDHVPNVSIRRMDMDTIEISGTAEMRIPCPLGGIGEIATPIAIAIDDGIVTPQERSIPIVGPRVVLVIVLFELAGDRLVSEKIRRPFDLLLGQVDSDPVPFHVDTEECIGGKEDASAG